MKDKKNNTRKLKRVIAMVLYQFQDPYYFGIAPQLAFFMFLAVVPMFVLLSQLLGIFQLSVGDIESWANITIAGEGTEELGKLLVNSPIGAGNIFLIIMAIWAASRLHFGLMRATNYTFTDGRDVSRGWFPDRVRAIVTMIVVMATIVVALAVLVYFPIVLKLVFGSELAEVISSSVWTVLRWPVVLTLYFGMIVFLYFALPRNRRSLRDIIPGSIFSAIAFLIVTALYNLYSVFNMGNSLMYGSISGIITLLLWFWIIGWVLIIGIVLNRVIWAVREKNQIPFDDSFFGRRMPIAAGWIRRFVFDNLYDDAGEIIRKE